MNHQSLMQTASESWLLTLVLLAHSCYRFKQAQLYYLFSGNSKNFISCDKKTRISEGKFSTPILWILWGKLEQQRKSKNNSEICSHCRWRYNVSGLSHVVHAACSQAETELSIISVLDLERFCCLST